jgi:hypothetical protein
MRPATSPIHSPTNSQPMSNPSLPTQSSFTSLPHSQSNPTLSLQNNQNSLTSPTLSQSQALRLSLQFGGLGRMNRANLSQLEHSLSIPNKDSTSLAANHSLSFSQPVSRLSSPLIPSQHSHTFPVNPDSNPISQSSSPAPLPPDSLILSPSLNAHSDFIFPTHSYSNPQSNSQSNQISPRSHTDDDNDRHHITIRQNEKTLMLEEEEDQILYENMHENDQYMNRERETETETETETELDEQNDYNETPYLSERDRESEESLSLSLDSNSPTYDRIVVAVRIRPFLPHV